MRLSQIKCRRFPLRGRHRRRTAAPLPPGHRAGMTERTLRDRAAIAGIGQTEFSKESGRSELQLAAEAMRAALADAGLTPADVDGMVTYTLDSSNELELARVLGVPERRYFA